MKSFKYKGFTLSEAMIVFTVLGVLAAILIPTLMNVSPDQGKLKAKKAYHTLSRAIELLTNSDTYAPTDGRLTATLYFNKANDGNSFQNLREYYFCQNLANAMNTTNINCTEKDFTPTSLGIAIDGDEVNDSVAAYGDKCLKDGAVSFVFANASSNGGRVPLCSINGNNDLSDPPTAAEVNTHLNTLRDAMDTACESITFYNFETSDGVIYGVQLTDFDYNGTFTFNGIETPIFYNLICFNTDKFTDTYEDGQNNLYTYTYSLGVNRDGKIILGTKLSELLQEDNSEALHE